MLWASQRHRLRSWTGLRLAASSPAWNPGARRNLLRVLTSTSEVRADVIRQFHERGNEEIAELLVLLEEREWARQAMIEELRASSRA